MSTWFPSHSLSLWIPHCCACEEQLSSHPHSMLCPTGVGTEVCQGMTQHTGSTQAQLQFTASLEHTGCLQTIVLGQLPRHVCLFRSGERLVHAHKSADITVNVNFNVWLSVFITDLTGFGTTQETHVWVCLCVSRDIYLKRDDPAWMWAHHPWTRVPDWKEEKRRKPVWHQYSSPFASCLWMQYDQLPTCLPFQLEPFSPPHVPWHRGLYPQSCEPKQTLPSLSVCIRFLIAMNEGNYYNFPH